MLSQTIHTYILKYIYIYGIYVFIYLTFLIHLSINGHLHCFRILDVVNNTVVKIRARIPFEDPDFFFFFCLFAISWATPKLEEQHMEVSRLGV